MEKPLISIIIAVYNNEKYIKNALRSVQNQGIENIEIIIIDDGSTDATASIVDEEARHDCRIKVIHQENQWIYASFNNGINAARGEYIYILNSDDRFAPGALNLLEKAIKKYKYPDVIYTKVCKLYCDENQNVYRMENINELVNVEEYINFESNENKWMYIFKTGLAWNQANLYKRELAIKHPFRNDVYGADSFFNIELSKYVKYAVILKEDIYYFHVYNTVGWNTSVGHYYEYEHQMFNEYYIEMIGLLKEKNILTEENKDFVRQNRRNDLRREIKNLLYFAQGISNKDKFIRIMNEYWDDIVAESFTKKGRYGFNELVASELANYFENKRIEVS